ncbi:SRPBCC domain-containing protein, partial [Rathayibacter sp. SD072]|uniref:SRPBCC domain-containing protein n=1 Tax=Rathayibacter sp. SD072 TaxID=2781731 RepID=UPI001A96A68E
AFVPHLSGCYLTVDPEERLVFTTALVAGWRPAAAPFITAVVTLEDHPDGTLYRAHVMHKDAATRDEHERLGFADGWGAVAAQLAAVVED